MDAEDSVLLRSDPAYGQTFVYGNVIVEPAGDGNSQLVLLVALLGLPDFNTVLVFSRTKHGTDRIARKAQSSVTLPHLHRNPRCGCCIYRGYLSVALTNPSTS